MKSFNESVTGPDSGLAILGEFVIRVLALDRWYPPVMEGAISSFNVGLVFLVAGAAVLIVSAAFAGLLIEAVKGKRDPERYITSGADLPSIPIREVKSELEKIAKPSLGRFPNMNAYVSAGWISDEEVVDVAKKILDEESRLRSRGRAQSLPEGDRPRRTGGIRSRVTRSPNTSLTAARVTHSGRHWEDQDGWDVAESLIIEDKLISDGFFFPSIRRLPINTPRSLVKWGERHGVEFAGRFALVPTENRVDRIFPYVFSVLREADDIENDINWSAPTFSGNGVGTLSSANERLSLASSDLAVALDQSGTQIEDFEGLTNGSLVHDPDAIRAWAVAETLAVTQ